MEIQEVTKEMYEALKKPLPSEAVKPHPTKVYLSSIKAVFVTERLNDVFGCGAWQIRTEKAQDGDKGMVVVKVTLTIPKYGVYYESFGGNDNGGEGSKNFDLGDAYKGATTDGITKIGSYLGIGIEVFKGHGNTAPKQEVKKEAVNIPVKVEQTPQMKAIFDLVKIEVKKAGSEDELMTIFKSHVANDSSLEKNVEYRAIFSERKKQLAV
jgi:hypothetical protein